MCTRQHHPPRRLIHLRNNNTSNNSSSNLRDGRISVKVIAHRIIHRVTRARCWSRSSHCRNNSNSNNNNNCNTWDASCPPTAPRTTTTVAQTSLLMIFIAFGISSKAAICALSVVRSRISCCIARYVYPTLAPARHRDTSAYSRCSLFLGLFRPMHSLS